MAAGANTGKGGGGAIPVGGGPSYGSNPYRNASQGIRQGFNTINMALDQSQDAYQQGAGTYRAQRALAPSSIANRMGDYMNPYEDQVVNRTMRDINLDRDRALAQVGGEAAAAGAFGGGRHGLVEGDVYQQANRTAGDMAANLRHQGFMDRAGLASQDIANQSERRYRNMDAVNRQREFNAAQIGSQVNDYFGNALDAASLLGNLSGQSYGMGRDLSDRQMQYGSLAQALNQAVLDEGRSMYDQYTGQPSQILQMRLASLGMNPLNNTGTTTTDKNPGYGALLGNLIGAAGNAFQFSYGK